MDLDDALCLFVIRMQEPVTKACQRGEQMRARATLLSKDPNLLSVLLSHQRPVLFHLSDNSQQSVLKYLS